MNDAEEDYEFYSILLKMFERIVPSPPQKSALELIETNIDSRLRFKMAFCASSLRDDISQWKAYTELEFM